MAEESETSTAAASATAVGWGEWMGAWKAEEGQADEEQERLSRQNAAFGGDTSARMKDLNILILGCRGVGVETAKNLILTNVGSVSLWDATPAKAEDLGANFYLGEASIGKPRAAQCLSQLKSLNPYCKVETLDVEAATLPECLVETNVLATGRGYSVVVVTDVLPRALLLKLNSEARSKGIGFLMALNMGVTTSIFSDFGPKHVITDTDGEPTQMLAIAGAEVITLGEICKVDGLKEGDKTVVLSLAADHSLQDGDSVALDDMRGDLAPFNGKVLKVRRLGVLSPEEAKVDLKDVAVKEMLKSSTSEVLGNFSKQYTFYKSKFDEEVSQKPEAEREKARFKKREITLFNRLCLVLEDGANIDHWASYQSGGLVNSVKPSSTMECESLEKTLVYLPNPQMLDMDVGLSGEGCWVHLALAAALKFNETKGKWPGLGDEADAAEFVNIAKAISEENRALEGACWLQTVEWGCLSGEPLAAEDLAKVEAKLARFSKLMQAELTGLCAFLGGAIAQEVIKKTGKFTPIEQWIHHDDPCLVGSSGVGAYSGSRYTYQAAVVGSDMMEKIRKQRIFLVGCGALGCEYLKGLTLMGACTAPEAKLIVTDMDRIEVSNLSRQFLFRQSDVTHPKSTTAARVVKSWNPEIKIEALEKGVGVTSEDFFDDEFWANQDLCWNALDNVVARKYTDRCCLWYGLPLLESGTLGTKSNSDVFLPNLTKSYNDGKESDANENQIAMCTLRSFPYLPLHCIEFAKQSYFSDYLEFAPQQYEQFRKDAAGFFEQLDAMGEAEQLKALKLIKGFITMQKVGQVDFGACVRKAFDHYCSDFITSIKNLVHTCDQMEKSTGKPFWTGTKRRPVEAKWDPSIPPAEAIEYLYATANCYAFIWKVPYMRNRLQFQNFVISLNLQVPAWSPPGSDEKVDVEGEDDGEKVDIAAIETLKGELYGFDTNGLVQIEVHDFEKDDDTNFHIDFLTISTNLRSKNYDIKLSERAHVKVTAGRIIPALATTTAMICGLVDLEFIKIVKGLHKEGNALDLFYNANLNLATGKEAMNVFRPEPAVKKETKLAALPEYTTWDKVEIAGEITVKQLVEELSTKYGVKVHRIYPANNDKVFIYDQIEVVKLSWKIEFAADGTVVVDPQKEVFAQWPQLVMAVPQFAKAPQGAAKKMFETQIQTAAKSLERVKANFDSAFNGPVSKAYVNAARPKEDEEKQKYFDTVFGKRPYIALQAHVLNSAGEEADLPVIRYRFR